ncbi:hypothetical protein [Taibaiella chishuiensis]|uniref:Uncharacterized protein n=1 Tax=Taibaiella chishuiensis TaxID=1434707 RepID=A0A2P8D7C3_9BACT|nr:hypothetical protein [Taibaiella chishuiensis]PSK93108.1 hypothetical protein B0I18_10277 [Taibaiella chishuiensis]
MKLTFKYKTRASTKWEYQNLALDDFFDLEDGAAAHINSIQKNWHLDEYISLDKKELMFVYVKLEDGTETREYKQTYWNEGKNIAIERTDEGNEYYRELIVSVLNSREEEAASQTLRLVLNRENIVPVYHGFFTDEADGIQTESRINLDAFKIPDQ